MKNGRIQRFTITEIVFHWLHAVLYLTLAVTGATMLLSRFLDLQTAGRTPVSTVHRVAGVTLVCVLAQTFLLSLFARMFRQFWLTLRQCLSWRRADVAWLLKVPLNMFSSRVSLPPVGRFNPGQKLHILIVFAVLIGFSASGLAIILVPGALAPWIVHLVCFVPAAFFLLLHLFLSLVNPQTRKALPCMFTGSISPDYAREHHALMLGKTDHTTHKPYVSWLAALIFLPAIGTIYTAKVWRHGFARFRGNISSTIASRGANLIMPGDLCESHAEGPQADRCATCHSLFSSISSDTCLRCHEDIGRILADEVGYHGRLSGPCRNCHAEHLGADAEIRRLDPVAFNHNLARFTLDGKHRDLPCQSCHVQDGTGSVYRRTRYIGLEFNACSDCHENPHKDARAADCTKCHVPDGWKQPNPLFVHDRDSSFPLDGEHSDTPCEKCHAPQQNARADLEFLLYGIGGNCSDCHSDPHQGQFTKNCESCHSTTGWTGPWLVDAHGSNSVFPLVGKHNSVACIECHRVPQEGARLAEARFVGIGRKCDHCHADPHVGQFARDCQTCHSEQGWKGRWLVDAHGPSSAYPLRGKHAAVACIKCHTPSEDGAVLAQARFVGLSTNCASCHEDPHDGQMRSSCDTCHAEQGWTGRDLLFAHDRHSEFKLDRIHADLSCASCHKTADASQYRPLPMTCELCHTDVVRQQLAQGYGVTARPDPHAGRVACAKCHSTDRKHQTPADYAGACEACHNRHYAGLFYNWMKSLRSRQSRANAILERRREQNAAEAAALEQRIDQARRVGFHNLVAAIKLWDDILAGGLPRGVQRQASPPQAPDR